MKIEGKLALLRQRLDNLYYRVVNRLQFFPFTLLIWVFNVAFRALQLRMGRRLVRVGEVTGVGASLPRNVMLWFGRIFLRPPGHQFDVCLRLPREAADANLQDVFSVALTFPHIRSIGLYWDSSSLADDLALLQSKQDRSDPVVSTTLHEEIGSRDGTQIVEFRSSDHSEFELPVAASRDAQTLLKRQAGAAHVVCQNVPTELRGLADAVAAAYAHVRFFHFSPEPPGSASAANDQSFFGWGFTLHERMALVQAADVYVGTFDELGCTAVIARRPAILLGGDAGEHPDGVSAGDISLWFPDPAATPNLTEAVLQFLSRQLGPGKR